MQSYDFEYDGLRLSDLGYIICKFDEDGLQTVSNGSQITFNTVSTLNGKKYELTSSQYDDCLGTTIQICKNSCNGNVIEISLEESRELMKWLNRKEFLKFKLLDIEHINIFYEASFNVNKIELNGIIYGLELNLVTNRPYALQESKTIRLKNMVTNGKKVILDTSDEEGFIYPDIEIFIEKDGDLIIHNDLENKTMIIRNCVVGEIITLKYPMIESSLSSHKLQNDFNWEFMRIANTFRNKRNLYTISIPCTIKLTYSPIVKIGI